MPKNIKCTFCGEPKKPCVATTVRIHNHLPISILFNIDLNTTRSFISPHNLRKIGINLNQLPPPPSKAEVYCFGRRVPNKLLGKIREGCSINFVTDTGMYEVPFDNFITIKSRKIINYAKEPSVLGIDFLKEFKLKLSVNVHRDQIELKT